LRGSNESLPLCKTIVSVSIRLPFTTDNFLGLCGNHLAWACFCARFLDTPCISSYGHALGVRKEARYFIGTTVHPYGTEFDAARDASA
jgi:hypothetical protein